jgi:hypothetical protein
LVVFLSFFTQVFLAIKVKTYEKVFTRGRGEGGTFICTAPVDPSHIYFYSSGIILKGLMKTLNIFNNDSSSKDSP